MNLLIALLGMAALGSVAGAINCRVWTPYGDVDLSTLGTVVFSEVETVDKSYNVNLWWVVNLCEPVDYTPDDAPPCTGSNGQRGYNFIQQRADASDGSPGGCGAVWNTTLGGGWAYNYSDGSLTATFIDVEQERPTLAIVSISCNASVSSLVAISPVVATSSPTEITYQFSLASYVACPPTTTATATQATTAAPSTSTAAPGPAFCMVQTPYGDLDLNPIGLQILDIFQVVNDNPSHTPYYFTFNLCASNANVGPNGTLPCTQQQPSQPAGFIQEYTQEGLCSTVWDVATSGWARNSDTGYVTATFLNWDPMKRWTATVNLLCEQATVLGTDGFVYVTGTAPELAFTFYLTSAFACFGTTPSKLYHP